MPLNPRQQAFVREYLVDHNAAQAAIRAGYSKATAKQIGSRLLTNVDVKRAVAKGTESLAEKAGVTAERLDAELARICFSDIRQAYDKQGKPLPVPEMPEDLARALAGIDDEEGVTSESEDGGTTVTVGGHRKLKVLSKTDAIKLFYQRLGLLKEKVEHSGEVKGVRFLISGVEKARK